jgi:RNA polymerase sigma-H factor
MLERRGPATRRRRAVGRDGEVALLMEAKQGDDTACAELCSRYRGMIAWKARSYYLAGADRDDIVQEGLIGLFKAIRDFDFSRQSSFRTFADLCVTRQMITAVKASTRRKHTPLNGYVSLSPVPDAEGTPQSMIELLAERGVADPAEMVVAAWESDFIRTGMAESMSSLESRVLALHCDGRSYQEIAEHLGCHTKTVDNALQRAKRKVESQVLLCRAS